MSDDKKANLFAKLAAQTYRPEAVSATNEGTTNEAPPVDETLPVSTPSTSAKPKTPPTKSKSEVVTGKRANPDYCQANAYVPRSVRRSVDRALLDIDGLDYSTLITELLRKWLKSRGVSE